MKAYFEDDTLWIQPENETEDYALEKWTRENTNPCDCSVKPMKLLSLSLSNLYIRKRQYKKTRFNDFYFNKLPKFLNLKMK